nr:transketolase [Cellulosimicrobium arenosum]
MSPAHTPLDWTDLDDQAVKTIKALAADAVEKVGNGHPGTAISLAPAAYLLFQKVMRHDPADAHWAGRDRFVLSAGHSSLTLYLQLFLAGYGLEMEDIAALRTWGSKTPGHPEYKHTNGVEITTGPLGQGLASAVGMAIAARRERGLLDPNAAPGTSPFDHHVYVIASDGDLQEGVTSEASSLAGHQQLGNLVVIWDDNKISIEDDTDIAFTEDVLARYAAYGWHTQRVDWTNGGTGYTEDVEALAAAVQAAKDETGRPSIIDLRTIIGWPSPTKQNTGGIHGSAMGADEVRGLKIELGLDPEATFAIADDVLAHTRAVGDRQRDPEGTWATAYEAWQTANPEGVALLERLVSQTLPEGWTDSLPTFETGKAVATRAASGTVLTALKDVLPELWGGSADLAGSNNTTMDGEPSFVPAEHATKKFPGDKYGRTLHFGIREHAMGSILNGIVLHGGTRVYGGTFLTFSDYMRPPVRLAALMQIPTTFVWTHDSIGLGEDGPTHQPIEQLAALRAIPGLDVVRPADANETAWAWRTILETTERPAGLILTRQGVPTFPRGEDGYADAAGTAKGAYVLLDAENGTPDVVLIGTGSEVQLAVEARETLAADGIAARVVSMPSREWFDAQDEAYRESVLPSAVRARVSVEAGVAQGWREIVGDAGRIIGIEHYGASADYKTLYREYGITAQAVADAARESIAAARGGDTPGGSAKPVEGGTGDVA